MIGFLQAHTTQLTQSISQLSLKPGDEEIKKKGWWKFWRRELMAEGTESKAKT